MAIDHLRAHSRDVISGDATIGDPWGGTNLSHAGSPAGQPAGPPASQGNSHTSVAAHAALFDGVATRLGLPTTELPLDATRQTRVLCVVPYLARHPGRLRRGHS